MIQWSKHRDLEAQISYARSFKTLPSRSQPQDRPGRSEPSSKAYSLRNKLEDYLTNIENGGENNSLTHLLTILANATPADLTNLIKDFQKDRKIEPGRPGRYSSLLPTLRLLHAEVAPLDALQSGKRLDAFSALSRKSPTKAIEWLVSASLSEKEYKDYLKQFTKIQILQNPAQHLDDWPANHNFNTTPVPLISSSAINDLLPEITKPENAHLKKSLVTSVLFSSLLEDEGLADRISRT